jgi:NAD-dependent deacetylase
LPKSKCYNWISREDLKLASLSVLKEFKKVAVITGAGVSAESGIPTFRGKDGLWNKYDPTELATPSAFEENPLRVWKWYLWRMRLIALSKPNPAHHAIAKLENIFPEFLLITQNVDGLHKLAGSRKLIEIHGNIFEGKCRFCFRKFPEDEFSLLFPLSKREFLKTLTEEEFKGRILEGLREKDLPRCPNCGELVGPGVVWFGESLEKEDIERSVDFCESSDCVIVAGTSGVVQPVASFPLFAKRKGAFIIEVNPEETPISPYADLTVRKPASKAFSEILEVLKC